MQINSTQTVSVEVLTAEGPLTKAGGYVLFLDEVIGDTSFRLTKAWALIGGKASAVSDDDKARVQMGTSLYQGMSETAGIDVAMFNWRDNFNNNSGLLTDLWGANTPPINTNNPPLTPWIEFTNVRPSDLPKVTDTGDTLSNSAISIGKGLWYIPDLGFGQRCFENE